ncbi:MAG: AarF/UbiB family protein, partial [Candidatus Omnitrophica bacterium]|nr:AarF/UbiB family protein [Candidatus Omnitrophota bacterium]
DERLFIPKVYKELCTEKILVLEYLDGIKINKIEEWNKYVDKEKVLKNGISIILKQIFDAGFFHGDPHPGNIFILKDGRIALIDFGIVGKLDEEKKYYLINLITGILKGRTDKIIYTLKLMDSIDRNTNIDELREDIEDLVDVYKDVPLKNIKIGEVIENSFEVMRKNKIKIPISFTLMGKSLITLEGICYSILPEFKFTEAVAPIFIEFIEKKLKFHYYFKNFQNTIERFQYIIRELPENIEYFIDAIKTRSLKNDLENNVKIYELNLNIKKTGIKISLSFIISAVLISSVFLFISGFFVYGILGFVATFALLIFLFFLIMKD